MSLKDLTKNRYIVAYPALGFFLSISHKTQQISPEIVDYLPSYPQNKSSLWHPFWGIITCGQVQLDFAPNLTSSILFVNANVLFESGGVRSGSEKILLEFRWRMTEKFHLYLQGDSAPKKDLGRQAQLGEENTLGAHLFSAHEFDRQRLRRLDLRPRFGYSTATITSVLSDSAPKENGWLRPSRVGWSEQWVHANTLPFSKHWSYTDDTLARTISGVSNDEVEVESQKI